MKNKWGPLNGGNLTPCRQLRYLFALSCRAARGEALLCCAMVGLSPIRCVDWRPVVRCSVAGECGAPWPCGLVVARAPLARLRRWCARRFFSATSSAACSTAVRAVRRRCTLSLLPAVVGGGLPVLANGSTLTNCPKLSPLANTGN